MSPDRKIVNFISSMSNNELFYVSQRMDISFQTRQILFTRLYSQAEDYFTGKEMKALKDYFMVGMIWSEVSQKHNIYGEGLSQKFTRFLKESI